MAPWLPGGLGGGGWCGRTTAASCSSRAALPIGPRQGWGRSLRPRRLVLGSAAVGAGAVAVWGSISASTAVPSGNSGSYRRPDTGFGSELRRMTDVMLAINVGVFLANLAMGGDKLLQMGAKVNSAILAGQWWRLLTCSALHGGVIHLLVNCMSLNNLGAPVEMVSGSARFTCIYVGSAFAGSLASFCFNSSPSVGASGAVFGLGAALALYFYRHKDILGKHSDDMLKRLQTTFLLNMVFGLLVRNIDNWGHLGGLLGGAAVAWCLGPRIVRERRLGSQRPRLVDRPPVPIFAPRSR